MHFQCAPHILLSASHQAAGLSTTGLQIAFHATRSPVALKIRKLTPTWLRRFNGSFQILRKSCEEVKSGFGFDVVYADDVLSVITVFISFVLQPDSDCTGVCDITVSGLNFQDGLPVVVGTGTCCNIRGDSGRTPDKNGIVGYSEIMTGQLVRI